MDSILISDFNSFFKNLSEIRHDHSPIETKVEKDIDDGGEQGGSGISYEVYKLTSTLGENFFIKLQISTDSYGNNEYVSGIQIVKPVEKVVTVFESI